MINTRRLAAGLSACAAAATILSTAPAFADATPPPTPLPLLCPPDLQNGQDIQEPDGTVQFCDEALGAGAVVAHTGPVLEQVIVAPGWTFKDASGGGGKVDIKFSRPKTDDTANALTKVEVRIERGKTEITGS